MYRYATREPGDNNAPRVLSISHSRYKNAVVEYHPGNARNPGEIEWAKLWESLTPKSVRGKDEMDGTYVGARSCAEGGTESLQHETQSVAKSASSPLAREQLPAQHPTTRPRLER